MGKWFLLISIVFLTGCSLTVTRPTETKEIIIKVTQPTANKGGVYTPPVTATVKPADPSPTVDYQCPPFTLPTMRKPPRLDLDIETKSSPAYLAGSLYKHLSSIKTWIESEYIDLIRAYRRYRKLCGLPVDDIPDVIDWGVELNEDP